MFKILTLFLTLGLAIAGEYPKGKDIKQWAIIASWAMDETLETLKASGEASQEFNDKVVADGSVIDHVFYMSKALVVVDGRDDLGAALDSLDYFKDAKQTALDIAKNLKDDKVLQKYAKSFETIYQTVSSHVI